jgi:glycosyltransferase involved in cell wall biosynthesis
MSGCMAVSPHLLAQVPLGIPRLLLRGVIGGDVLQAGQSNGAKQNRVCFSGTHVKSNGIAELIDAWRALGQSDWELHITGYGELTDALRAQAAATPGVVFHGLVSRPKLVELISSAKICINPHAVSQTPGNVFAFKIIEYLAAGSHVVTTPMGALERELEAGVTYMPDNTPQTIAATLKQVIETHRYERRATQAAQATYGPDAVSRSLDALLKQVVKRAAETGERRQRVEQAT